MRYALDKRNKQWTIDTHHHILPDFFSRETGTCGRCEWCQRGRRMFCPYLKGTGTEAQGGHAEYMLMNADATYLIPDKVSYEQAAPHLLRGLHGLWRAALG